MRLLTASVGPFDTRERTPGHDLVIPAGDGAAELVDLWGAGLVLEVGGELSGVAGGEVGVSDLVDVAEGFFGVPGQPDHMDQPDHMERIRDLGRMRDGRVVGGPVRAREVQHRPAVSVPAMPEAAFGAIGQALRRLCLGYIQELACFGINNGVHHCRRGRRCGVIRQNMVSLMPMASTALIRPSSGRQESEALDDFSYERSMRAGTLVPATPGVAAPGPLNGPLRSMRAGTLVPATPLGQAQRDDLGRALNEGRNFSSGNTSGP